MENISTEAVKSKNALKPINSILVSQPKPTNPKSPYYHLEKKYDLSIYFKPFIEVRPVSMQEFRKQKSNPLDYTAIIFTSRRAIDHFFAICKKIKTEMPANMKYFCVSDQTANYLQKYIIMRKRKVFVGKKTAQDLLGVLKKHEKEKFLFPCSDVRRDDIPSFLKERNYNFKELVIYHTVATDLSDLADVNYDMIAFFSPSGIDSLFKNFPDFEQKNTRIAAFGPTTAKAVREKNLVLHVEAPLPNAPSMTGAIELYIKKANRIDEYYKIRK